MIIIPFSLIYLSYLFICYPLHVNKNYNGQSIIINPYIDNKALKCGCIHVSNNYSCKYTCIHYAIVNEYSLRLKTEDYYTSLYVHSVTLVVVIIENIIN